MMFRGLSAFPLTPADAGGQVDEGALRALLARLAGGKADSVGLLGSTGTYLFLDRAQRRRAVEAARAALGDTTLMVGIGALRTDEAIRLGQDARAAGADAVLLAPVSYTPLTEDEVFAHFAAVAEAVDLPLCVYDNPSTTRFAFTPALLGRLAGVANIVVAKLPAGAAPEIKARLDAVRHAVGPDFAIGCSVDWHARAALQAGASTWFSVAGGLFPKACQAMMRDASAEVALRPLWGLFGTHGSLRVIHEAARQMGLVRTELPRPLLPLGDAVRAAIAAAIRPLV